MAWVQDELFDLLYGGTAPHQRHSDTSRAAAVTLDDDRRATLRGQVYRFLRQHGDDGATDEEIQQALDLNGNTERPRRCELFEAGMVADSGMRRLTRNGRKAVVWIARSY